VLPVGGLAVARLLGHGRLTECIGERFPLGEAVAVPLPHPSGASGWLNDAANRGRLERALELVRRELARPA
jgi:uracil-DNA glycosylase